MAPCRPRPRCGSLPARSFDLNGISQTVDSLADDSFGANGTVINNGATPVVLTLAPAGGSAAFSGSHSGRRPAERALTLNGAGTQILAGNNTYSGLTTITAGTLQLGNGGATGSINSTSSLVNNSVLAFNRLGHGHLHGAHSAAAAG